jgi:hypothetical protein
MMPPRRRAAAPAAALALLLAACQPLPHPFAFDRPPAALLRVRDSVGVAIAPIVGVPKPAARKLADAMAKALLKHDIPASDRTTSLGSYQLYGRLDALRPRQGQAALVALWRLYDAKGHTVGERRAEVPLPEADNAAQAADDKLIEALAGLSADRLAPLLEDQPPPARPAVKAAVARQAPPTRIAVGRITGAPGDGAAALAEAVTAVLRTRGLAIAGTGEKPDLFIDCAVSVVPSPGGTEHVALVWRVRRADGGQIGTVGQQNDVPKAALAGRWGDLAYNIATAAGGGLMQLVAHAMPEPQP